MWLQLVVSTQLKNISQNENLPQVGGKIAKWHHHLVVVASVVALSSMPLLGLSMAAPNGETHKFNPIPSDSCDMCHQCVSPRGLMFWWNHMLEDVCKITPDPSFIYPLSLQQNILSLHHLFSLQIPTLLKNCMSHRDNISLNSYLNKNIYNKLTHCGKADSCFRLVLKCFEFPTHRNWVLMLNPHNPRYAGDKRCDSSTQICGRPRREETFLLRGQTQLLLPIVCNLSIVSFKILKTIYLAGYVAIDVNS